MITHPISTRPVKALVFGFMGFAAAAATVAAAQKMGAIEPASTKRALGLLVGVMVAITGNFLPKVRPLNAPGVNPGKAAAAAERLAGWTLVLVGIAYVALFVLSPLEEAKRISSILGIAAIVLIAANWAWLVRGMLFGGKPEPDETAAEQRYAAEKRKLVVSLLFAFFYAFATACAAFLFRDRQTINEITWWMSVVFWLIYGAIMVALDAKRSVN